MTLSLRGRLLIGVITLVVVGLLVANVATYFSLQSFLISRVDDQLRGGVDEASFAVGASGSGPTRPTAFPIGTVVEQLGADDSVVNIKVVASGFRPPASAITPVLPKTLPNNGNDTPASPFTVEGSDGKTQFRMTDWPEGRFGGQFVVLAVPLTDVQSTLAGLLGQQAKISLGVVGGTAILAFIIVTIGLRPLQRMGGVAQQIAGGDLSRRVEPTTPGTEIGRLGIALNTMLNQIESAFAERTASNTRLRRFIADASHELRTPLTSIRGYSEMLRRGASESPADSELARRRIEEEAVRMSTLVDDMLMIARLDQGRPLDMKPVDLQKIAIDAAADARVVAPLRKIELEAPTAVTVPGDDTRLRQVLGNLVRNALVHTPPQTPIEIGVAALDGHAVMSVIDHGPGLRPEELEKIFEPFYRADLSRSRDSGGAGLGLSIVNAVVLAHGGHVKVNETAGGGVTFEVELPLTG